MLLEHAFHAEETTMQFDCVIVGHPGQIVTNQARTAHGRGLFGIPAPKVRKRFRFRHEQGKELAQDPFGLAAHAVHFVVFVHALIEKRPQSTLIAVKFLRERNQRLRQCPNVRGAFRIVLLNPATGFSREIIDPVSDQTAHGLKHDLAVLQGRKVCFDRSENISDERLCSQIPFAGKKLGDEDPIAFVAL